MFKEFEENKFSIIDKSSKCILVVDDETPIRELCAEILHDDGYNVVTACDGKQALEKIQDCNINLVLMDVMMPNMDGPTTCKMIKADARSAGIPVVLMSATFNSRTTITQFDNTVVAVVAKPFDFDFLIETINQMVS